MAKLSGPQTISKSTRAIKSTRAVKPRRKARPQRPRAAVRPRPVPSISAAMLEQARQLYEGSATPLTAIAKFLGVGVKALSGAARREGWQRDIDDAIRPDGRGLTCPGLAGCPMRGRLLRRLAVDLERRLEAMEMTSALPRLVADRERAVRMLSAMVRNVEKLEEMERAALVAHARKTEQSHTPYDLEKLRAELADQIEKLCQRETDD